VCRDNQARVQCGGGRKGEPSAGVNKDDLVFGEGNGSVAPFGDLVI